MSITVKPINSIKEKKNFIRFKNNLYKNNQYAVPTLEIDQLESLNLKKNPAGEFCECQCFLAYNTKGEIIGRIAAIINHKANKTWNRNDGRFGFFDFIEDIEVAKALLASAEAWLKERGVDAIHGPLGFTDMDEEGMLVEGFNELGTMATLYNYPYYSQFMEKLGYVKDIDWVEKKITIPTEVPEKIKRLSSIVLEKNNLKVVKAKNTKEIIKNGWGDKVFELVNSEYAKLYGFSEITPKQIKYYVKMYFPMLSLDLITLVTDTNNNLVGFGITMPSLSKALQKANGKMLPFGWFHMLKALKSKKVEIVDLLLIAVKSEYQNKGVTAIIIDNILTGMNKLGVKYAESNPELETNYAIQNQWEILEYRNHKRRRIYIKSL